MSKNQNLKRVKIKQARLEIVAQLYKRAYSYRQIQAECMRRLDLKSYSIDTLHKDVQTLLAEWRAERVKNVDDALQVELSRIDDTVQELWEQWEKSKEDWQRTTSIRKGAPKKKNGHATEDGKIETYGVEEMKTNVVGLGDPRYIAEIRAQLMERRKLLGLYAPEKKDVTSTGSFAHYLIESGLLDDAEQQLEPQNEEEAE